ncbi:CAP domain-containing protein [Kerstersia gyiorum]|uniref:CAP domain-containing protein n=1 Tax=Kerstersia gyiorum TaxID=206506 RepID=UPI003B42B88A
MTRVRQTLSATLIATLAACGGGDDSNKLDPIPDYSSLTPEQVKTQDVPTYTDGRLEGLNYINEIRVAAGLVPFKQNTGLDVYAQHHANYLALNKKATHGQDPNLPGGLSTQDQIKNAGVEHLSFDEYFGKGFSSSWPFEIKAMLATLYHRQLFLSNSVYLIGMATTEDHISPDDRSYYATAFQIGCRKRECEPVPIPNGYFVYPLDNSTDNLRFNGGELPDPDPRGRAQGVYIGSPVSIGVGNKAYLRTKVFTLNCEGEEIDGWIETAGLTSFVPRIGLPANAWCTATFQGEYGLNKDLGTPNPTKPIVHTWRFKTGDQRGPSWIGWRHSVRDVKVIPPLRPSGNRARHSAPRASSPLCLCFVMQPSDFVARAAATGAGFLQHPLLQQLGDVP